MKEIIIKTVEKDKSWHIVRLGNGTEHRFPSIKQSRKFLADTNRFLTSVTFNLNATLIQLYTHGRELWIINEDVSYSQIKDRFATLEHFLKQAWVRASFRDGNYFSFIDLKKYCEHAKDLIKYFKHIPSVGRADTLRRHQLDSIYDQINSTQMQLQNYGNREAYNLFNVSRIEMISDYADSTALKIA